jgi:hypothetical protein
MISGSNAGRSLPEHNRTAAEGEVADSHIHLVAEVDRNSEVAVVVVVLHILRGIQIRDRLTFLLDDVIEKKKERYRRWLLGVGQTPKGASER